MQLNTQGHETSRHKADCLSLPGIQSPKELRQAVLCPPPLAHLWGALPHPRPVTHPPDARPGPSGSVLADNMVSPELGIILAFEVFQGS